MTPSPIEIIAAALFALAIAHTFASRFFEHLAHRQPTHARLWHLLGEVEVVFGFWGLILILAMFASDGSQFAKAYISGRDFTEPMFVFVIMIIAATRPILDSALAAIRRLAAAMPLPGSQAFHLTVLVLVPLLGALITEPAAMTLAALMLGRQIFAKAGNRLKYATLGVLFVNISIGGTLSSFAAPPVLMVAGPWGWSSAFMLATFGYKAVLAVLLNAGLCTLLFRQELAQMPTPPEIDDKNAMPLPLVAIHLAFLTGVVVFSHYPAIFMGLFLFFIGLVHAYPQWQNRLMLREGLLVAFFLAGLVVLGGQQQWWLQPLLLGMNSDAVFFGAIALTALTDNAALTYLGSLVDGLSASFQYALVAGAVTGGGLTIIANAPNPAGIAILREHFEEGAVKPVGLLLAALPPTFIAALAFRLL